MRRRLPSPALVIASIALFVVLGGAGFAAATAFVRAAKPTALVFGSMSADGKLVGGLSHGTEISEGVYSITVRGDTFAPNGGLSLARSAITPQVITITGSGFDQKLPPTCAIANEAVTPSGGATLAVDCFTYDAASGSWQPASAAFDFQIVGPSR